MQAVHKFSDSPFKLTGSCGDPSGPNYDIKGYHKERIVVKGELREIGYYINYDPITKVYSDLVVKEYRSYVRDAIKIIIYRSMRIDYYTEEGEVGFTKTMNDKYFSPDEAIQEGQTRRNNLISAAKIKLLEKLQENHSYSTSQYYGFLLLDSVSLEMNKYKEGKTSDLKNAISASTLEFMTTAVKEAVVEELTF